MRVRFSRGSRGRVAVTISALAVATVPVARAQVVPPAPTVEASSRIAGAVPSQMMDTGLIPATADNQATVNDSFSGPIQIGTVAIGSGNVSVSASSAEGTFKLFTQNSDAATVATVALLTNAEAQAVDSVQITRLPSGQGQLSALYFPTTLANGGTITGNGGTWSGSIRLTATIQDYASDGTLRGAFTLAATYTNANTGAVSNDTGPAAIPLQLGDTLTINVDEALQTSTSAPRGATSSVTADFGHPTHLFLVPQSPGLAFTSASGHSYLPPAGDADVNGTVDFSDLLTLAQHYGQTNASWADGDFNGDGTVDFGDLLALAQNYGQSLNAGQAAAAPEPSALVPVGFGAALLLCRVRRSRLTTSAPGLSFHRASTGS